MKVNRSRIEEWFLKLVGPWIESPPRVFRKSFLKGIFRLQDKSSPGRKVVYITFDDGPIPESTPWLLTELDRLGVKATFFMVGDNVRKYPELYKNILAHGHKAGNHTMHHLAAARMSIKRYVLDVYEATRYIKSDLFRPPHGWMRFSQKELLSWGFRIIMYDLVTRDYSKYVDSDHIVATVKKYARPGSIIVFHDSLKSIDKLKTALPESVNWLKEQGYEFQLIPSKKDLEGEPDNIE